LLNDKNNKREKTMKEVIALVKSWLDDLVGESGFAGLVALLVLVGLFRK